MNALEQLRSMTVVVADTGDFEAMRALKPQDATTNPSLITKAAALPAYADLVKATQRGVNADSRLAGRPEVLIDRLAVAFGCEILKIVPGRVSTEVDARLSFDTAATVSRARGLMDLYRQARIDPNRVLIKIAATWEGIRAAEILEKEGIHCNLTLLFSLPQAIACAEAGVTLISPFVGRILDWHKAARKVDHIPAEEDPGVLSVREIYAYYKAHGYPTEVMGASFRNKEEILALAGCDLLTISPELLKELESLEAPVPRQLSAPSKPGLAQARPARMTEAQFRWQLNEDPMATEKLAQGIRAFAADLVKLEGLLA